ncbi:unnamed protein product, partial [Mesorhabditis spiculigera]
MLPSKLLACLLLISSLNGVFVRANNATTQPPPPRCPPGMHVCTGWQDEELCMPLKYKSNPVTTPRPTDQSPLPDWMYCKSLISDEDKCIWGLVVFEVFGKLTCTWPMKFKHSMLPYNWTMAVCARADQHGCRGKYGAECIEYSKILEIKRAEKAGELDECIMERPTEPPARAEGDEKKPTQSSHGVPPTMPALVLLVLVLKAFG